MSLTDAFLKHVGPGAFTGASLGQWLGVLHRCRYDVDWPYWCRAAMITMNSLPNTLIRGIESLLYKRAIERTQVQRPLFVLGVWRGGTTHLQNLLSIDRRFAFANFYQVMNPHTFLLTERTGARFLGLFLPKTRLQDNVRFGVNQPQEDEFALCCSGHSFLLAMAFPRCRGYYDRRLTLRDLDDDELIRWQAELLRFVKKITYRYQRPLVLKSPGHTARIRLLLEMFPDARFVHIRRNPYDVFQSSRHTVRKLAPWWTLQRHDFHDLDDQVIRQYKELYDAYFEERPLIGDGRFCEVSFEALESDPIGQLRGVYESLDLPDFAVVEPDLQEYVQSLSNYRKNEFPELSNELKRTIAQQWQRCFETWGYPT